MRQDDNHEMVRRKRFRKSANDEIVGILGENTNAALSKEGSLTGQGV